MPPARTDKAGVRIGLTHKFVLGSLVVALTAIGLPQIVRAMGVDFPAWGAFFVALGAGGGIGFFLSGLLGRKFEGLRRATERIREGDLATEIRINEESLLSDETDDLARTRELYDWLDGNDEVRFLPVGVVNDPSRIGRNRAMTSVNGALAVDLFGQVAADTLEGRQHSGIGGHEDFTSGAGLPSGGRSLICLPSTAGRDERRISRIVPALGSDMLVTTPRHQLDVVVTEFGAADVLGLDVEQRARALIDIAHPDHREELAEQWAQRRDRARSEPG